MLSTGPSTQDDTNLGEPELTVHNVEKQFGELPTYSAVLSNHQDCSHAVELIGFKDENCCHKKQRDWKPAVSSFGQFPNIYWNYLKIKKEIALNKDASPGSGQIC